MMPITSKRLLPDDIEKLNQLRRKYLLKHGREILFCALFFGLFVFSYHTITSYGQSVTGTTFMLGGAIPVPVLVMKPGQETWYDPYLIWLLLGIAGAYLAISPLC